MGFHRLTRTLLAYCLIGGCALAQAEEDALDYFYTPQVGFDQQPLINRIFIHARNTEYDNALSTSELLLAEAESLKQSKPVSYGEMMVNHGILLAALARYDEALPFIEIGLSQIEQSVGPFSEELVNGIMVKALTQMGLDEPAEAADTFRRAQHITHRTGGVYSKDQMIMLNYLTATSLRQGDPHAADVQQLFSLKVAEQAYGPESKAILPTLSRLGSYFASRGSTIPIMAPTEIRMLRDSLFKHSITMYERALDIVAQNYGEGDIRLVPHLRGMANARLLQVTSRHRAEDALRRSLEIIQNQPDATTIDKAQAHIDIGDLYIITSNINSDEFYLKAWEMLQETERTRDIAQSLFGVPVRLYPRRSPVFYLDRMPDAAEGASELFVELEYNVNEKGRVRDIRVLEKNVPNENVRELRQTVRNLRYRPRIEEGQVVRTEGLRLHQLFKVYGRNNEFVDDFPSEAETETEVEAADSAVADDEVS